MKISISIPTYNRVNFLMKAIEEIKIIRNCDDASLCLAISNIASDDDTSKCLSLLSKNIATEDLEIAIYNSRENEINCNWYYLDKVIATDVDWVWMHGDDDVIIDKECLHKLAPFLCDENLDFIIVPQAKRVGLCSDQKLTGTLFEMSKKYGVHDLLGWVSQIIVRREIYHKYAVHHFEITKDVNTREDFISHRYSSFPHVNFFFENYSDNMMALIFDKIIEEQVRPEYLNSHNAEPKFNRAFREGVFSFAEQMSNQLINKNLKVPLKFFRYVNKNLIFLMLDMAIAERSVHGVKITTLSKQHKIILQKIIQRVDDAVFVHIALLFLECIESCESEVKMTEISSNINFPMYNFEVD